MFIWEIIVLSLFAIFVVCGLTMLYLAVRAEGINPTPKMDERCDVEDEELIIKNTQNEDTVNRCICCGEIIPEGRWVCPICDSYKV